jgi:membrane protease YdiL (CAAX protease family)
MQRQAAVFGPPRGAPAGWYPDPYGSVYARYFDGYRWTPYVGDPAQLARWAPKVEEPHPQLPLPVTIGAVVILAASLITQRELSDRLLELDWNIVAYMAINVVVAYAPSVAWMWYASRRWGTGRLFADLGVRFRWVDCGWGPIIYLGTVVAVGITVGVFEALDLPYRGNLDLDGQNPFERDNTAIASLLIAFVVVAPVIEEALFRGAVMRGLLSRFGAVTAIGTQAVLFGAAHYVPDFGVDNVGLVTVLSVAGAGLGLGAYLTRRLGPVIIAHALMNGVAMAVALT